MNDGLDCSTAQTLKASIPCPCLTSHIREEGYEIVFYCYIWADSGVDSFQTNLGAKSSATTKQQAYGVKLWCLGHLERPGSLMNQRQRSESKGRRRGDWRIREEIKTINVAKGVRKGKLPLAVPITGWLTHPGLTGDFPVLKPKSPISWEHPRSWESQAGWSLSIDITWALIV